MSINLSLLKQGFCNLELELTDDMVRQLSRYGELLLDWNTRMNLTAITDPDAVTVRHFIDSATLLHALPLPEGARIIDVGTGAGFPGAVLKILRPDLSVTLLDSQRKRTEFLSALTHELGIPCEILQARAEDAARNPRLREGFDLSCARAVAELRILAELCLPFVRTGGFFAAMKGPGAGEELQAAKKGIDLLGGRIFDTKDFVLPDSSSRSIVFIKKISQTPTKYPRPYAKIVKAPL